MPILLSGFEFARTARALLALAAAVCAQTGQGDDVKGKSDAATGSPPGFDSVPLQIFEWERGFGLRVPGQPAAEMYLWFYEWNMFEAMAPGQHTQGTYKLPRRLEPEGREAVVDGPDIRLTMRVVPGGAELTLQVSNRTQHSWPELAGVIPCWNPGLAPSTDPSARIPQNRNFADAWRLRSFFVSAQGLEQFSTREIHFNARHRAAIDRAAGPNGFVFSTKWPTSSSDAVAGLLVRESEDGQWVTGIAWEEFLSVQGHNPWNCLHACARVGPLRPGESRTIRGWLYLFRGTKEECLARFQRDLRKPRP
jgi:hypothetical protein